MKLVYLETENSFLDYEKKKNQRAQKKVETNN